MKKDIITGLVEEILNEYNTENDTRIKFENLDIDEIKEQVTNLIWCQIEQNDI